MLQSVCSSTFLVHFSTVQFKRIQRHDWNKVNSLEYMTCICFHCTFIMHIMRDACIYNYNKFLYLYNDVPEARILGHQCPSAPPPPPWWKFLTFLIAIKSSHWHTQSTNKILSNDSKFNGFVNLMVNFIQERTYCLLQTQKLIIAPKMCHYRQWRCTNALWIPIC